jgi:hypothetical protein
LSCTNFFGRFHNVTNLIPHAGLHFRVGDKSIKCP